MMKSSSIKLLVGTYTQKEGHVDGKADGIYLMEMNQQDGSVTIVDAISGIVNPSYAVTHSNGRSIYAVSEVAGSTQLGQVYAYTINSEDKNFKKVSALPSYGNAPCHLFLDETSMRLYVVNYMGGITNYQVNKNGSLSSAPQSINYEGGKLGSTRQEGPHPHMIQRFGDFVYVSDLGTDQIITYSVNDNGILQEISRTSTSSAGGPRHFAVHPSNGKLYVTNELNLTIQSFEINRGGSEMALSQTISLHNGLIDQNGHSAAAIKIHPSGKYLYAAMRAGDGSEDNTIQQFNIEANGKLKHISSTFTKGSVPRDFEISPDGSFLLVANQNSDNIVTFKIDQISGNLNKNPKISNVKTPVSIKFF